jgi:hypothetical protein
MPEIICPDCGKRIFHENPDTLKIEDSIHKKFCRKKEGDAGSYMHRGNKTDFHSCKKCVKEKLTIQV